MNNVGEKLLFIDIQCDNFVIKNDDYCDKMYLYLNLRQFFSPFLSFQWTVKIYYQWSLLKNLNFQK